MKNRIRLIVLSSALVLSSANLVKAIDTSDTYPRISAMELTLLGSSHPNDSLGDRLSRLEVKAFGKASTGDLSDRTDKLQDYVESKLKKPVVAPDPGYVSDERADKLDSTGQPSQAGSSEYAGTKYPRVTALEEAILGQNYDADGADLNKRLSRMEVKVFGQALEKNSLGDRTDALEDYAEKKLHKNILGQSEAPQNGMPGQATGGGGSNVLSKVGNALFGIPPAGTQGQQGPSFFIPGFGPFAGVRVQPKSALQQQQQLGDDDDTPKKPALSKADEDAINSTEPPPASARLITKVSWCEKRVFGMVYQDKHLTERLDFLNNALKFDPGQKGMALMDDVDKLMQAAQKIPAR
jgi:hypothetical protein